MKRPATDQPTVFREFAPVSTPGGLLAVWGIENKRRPPAGMPPEKKFALNRHRLGLCCGSLHRHREFALERQPRSAKLTPQLADPSGT
jgi:hypothetical protein